MDTEFNELEKSEESEKEKGVSVACAPHIG